MPAVQYRSMEHAVAGKGRWGYYKRIEYQANRGDELMLTTNEGTAPWPLRLVIQAHIFNHEDLDRFTSGVMALYEELRGEQGENEVRSPSSVVPFKR